MKQQFPETRWSLILRVSQTDTSARSDALGELCSTYWFPVYASVRGQGYSPEDAQDLTQDFFARVLEDSLFDRADPARGRMRSFLLGILKNVIAHQWESEQTKKRGGQYSFICIDQAAAERQWQESLSTGVTPENEFDRQWAVAVFNAAFTKLESHFASLNKRSMFEELKSSVAWNSNEDAYEVVAQRLGMTEAAVGVAVYRMRKRYRQLLETEILETLASPEELADEIRYLTSVLSR